MQAESPEGISQDNLNKYCIAWNIYIYISHDEPNHKNTLSIDVDWQRLRRIPETH